MSKQVNRKELVDRIADCSALTKRDTDKFLDSFVQVVTESLKQGEELNIMGFGKFLVRERAERAGVNPRTKEPMVIAATKTPAFKVASTLKRAVVGEV